jgi:hypothetical protein
MIFIIDAIKISIERILISFLNIILFRNIYALSKQWLNGTFAFLLTIYLMGKVRSVLFELLVRLKHRIWPNQIEIDSFKKENLKSIELDQTSNHEIKKSFLQYVEKNGRNDLFRLE